MVEGESMAESNGESESDQVQINFRASRKQKQEWKEQAEEEGFKSFSDFLRVAVESFTVGEERGSAPDSTVSDSQLSELIEQTKAMNKRLNGIETDLSGMKRELEDDEELRELANQLFELMPDEKPGTTAWKEGLNDLEHRIGSDDDRSITLSNKEARNAWEGTLEGLSVALDESEYMIRKGIDRLQRDNLIKTAEVDGQKRFWKEV